MIGARAFLSITIVPRGFVHFFFRGCVRVHKAVVRARRGAVRSEVTHGRMRLTWKDMMKGTALC